MRDVFLVSIGTTLPVLLWTLYETAKQIYRAIKKNDNSELHLCKNIFHELTLNPEQGLHLQPLFWFSILTPFAVFLSFGVYAWEGFQLDFSYDGFENFIRLSKLPLGLLGLSLPLAVLVSRLHSTVQTATQIEIANGSAIRDQYKINKDQFSSAQEQFCDLIQLNWDHLSTGVAPQFKELNFKPAALFNTVFTDSSARKGLLPRNCDNLAKIKEIFEKLSKGWEFKENKEFINHMLTALSIYSNKDFSKESNQFFEAIVIFISAIEAKAEKIEDKYIS